MTTDLGFPVELCAGGTIYLHTEEEVSRWEEQATRYQEDYALQKLNDLALVDAILTQQTIIFRAQMRMSGLEPDTDDRGQPKGGYRRIEKQRSGDIAGVQGTVTKAAEEIRSLEKSLGIDKKTREAGGQHTVAAYVERLKRAAHQYGVHIADRVKEYEKVMMEARWKLRLLKNGDEEDKQYHGLTEEKFCEWLEGELARIEQLDKDWAKNKGKVFVGQL